MSETLGRELLDLGVAVGLLTGEPPDVELNEPWFADPGGHLARVLTDAGQREAVLRLARSALGAVGAGDVDLRDLPPGETWLPVATSDHPPAGLFVVVAAGAGDEVQLSVAGRLAAEDVMGGRALESAATVVVPLVRLRAGVPAELLLGSAAGAIRAGAAVTAPDGLGGGAADLDLRGVALDVAIPTDGAAPTLAVALRGLRLPGEAAARDVSIADPQDLAGEVVELLAGLVQAQAGSAGTALGHLLALVGIDPPAPVPPLPLADALERGLPALGDWARALAADAAAVRAWLGELAGLLGAGAGAVTGAGTDEDPFVVEVTTEPRGRLLLRVVRDPATGVPVLRPAVAVAVEAPAGAPVDGGVTVEAELLALRLGPVVSATALPGLVAAARLAGPAGAPLVDTTVPPAGTAVRIGSARAGVALSADRRLVPLLELRDVRIGAAEHAVLDLSSADAIGEAAAGALEDVAGALVDALAPVPEARAIAALAGLVRPAGVEEGDPWPALAALPQLFADPVRELGAYHARVLTQAGAWRELAADLATLVRAGGPAPGPPSGDGTPELPWTTPVFGDPGIGVVELLAWTVPDGDRTLLHVGARIRPPAVAVGGSALTVTLVSALVRVSLPTGAAEPPFPAVFAPGHVLTARLGDDLVLDPGPVALLCEAIEAALRWSPAGGLQASLTVVDGRLRVAGEEHPLPAVAVPFGAAPALDRAALPWDALEALAGQALAALGPWPAALARAVGWTPGAGDLHVTLPRLPGLDVPFAREALPRLSLELLSADPAGALRTWLGGMLGAEDDGPDLSLVLAGWLAALLPAGLDPDAGALSAAVGGSGTHADPWAVRLAAGAAAPELLLWLDPEGPALTELPGLLDELVPADLGGGVAGLVDALEQAAAIVPELARALDGRAGLEPALVALRAALAGSDGLVGRAAQAPGGTWTTADLGPVAHLAQPAAFDAAAHLPAGAPPAARRVLVAAPLPGAAPWPGQDAAHVIDLRAPGLAPEAFDVSTVPAAGPYVVLLPKRAAAGGFAGVVARLRRALGAIRAAAGGPLCVVAHSAAGLAARAVAAEPGISHLVTLGTPHAGATAGWATDAATADAVRALQALRALAGPDRAPLDGLLATLGAALDGGLDTGDLAAVTLPPLHADVVAAHALTAGLGAAELDAALEDATRRALEAAAAHLPGWGGPSPTHAGAGLRVRLPPSPPAAGGVAVAATVRLDLGRLELRPGGEPRSAPRVEARVQLRRADGWLAGGPAADPRVRWAELELGAELGDPAVGHARVVLHEAAALGVARQRWVLDEGLVVPGGDETGTLVPEARVLLGEIARAAGPLPAGSPGRALAEVLQAAGLAEVAADGAVAVLGDPLERLLVDPLGELRARAAGDRAPLLAALARWLGVPAPAGDELALPLGTTGLVLGAALGADGGLRLTTAPAGLALADGVVVDGQVTLARDGRVTGGVAAARGGLGLRASVDSHAAEPLTLALDPPGDAEPVALVPVPDGARLQQAAAALVLGELARLVLAWADREAPAIAGPAITALGLRGSVRNAAGLLADPAGWLTEALPPRADGRPGLSPSALRTLVDGARAVLAPAAPAGTLPLPWGLALSAGEDGGDAVATLGWAAPVPAGAATLGGALRLRLGAGFAVTPGLDATAQVGGLAGLDRIGVALAVDGTVAATLTVRREAGGDDLVVPLLPSSGGLGALAGLAAGAAVDALLPLALDALAGHPDAGPPVAAAGDALGLRPGGTFSAAELRGLAGDPAGQLAGRLAAGAADALSAAAGLAALVLPAGAVTSGERPGTGTPFVRVDAAPTIAVTLELPAAGPPGVCVEVTGARPIPELAVSGRACAGTAGITRLQAAVEVTDPGLLRLGAASALPFAAVDAVGPAARVEAGIWTAPPASTGRRALVAVVPLAGGDPALVCRPGDGSPDDPDLGPCFAEAVRVWLVPLAVELLTEVDLVVERLEQELAFAPGTSLGSLLADAELLVRDAAGPRYDLAPGALDPDELGLRVLALAAHAVRRIGEAWGGPDALHPLTVQLASDEHGGRTVFGVRLGLAEPLRLLNAGGVEVHLEAVAAPDLVAAGAQPGVELLVVSLPSGSFDAAALELRPWIKVVGVGLRASGAQGGKLVDLGASVDAVAVHAVFERNDAEPAHDGVLRAGGRILLANIGVPLGATGGGNPVAQGLLGGGDASTEGDEEPLRPAFSPALTIVRTPPAPVVVRFRAGEGEGPWWLAIQRRFGPLYVDQVGLGSEERAGGEIERVKLLLDGGVSLAGLAVQVDDLSLSIPFERPYALDEWRLDLAGLAVGYEGGAVQIAGGLRKRSGSPPDYVGMLLVRAGQFGLTAVGGYAEQPVAPGSDETYTSLFVFAALSFPLGGPPAFFVTGLGGGVGLNRRLVVPDDLAELPSFPLLAAMDPSSPFAQDPMGALDGLAAAFPPERGRLWLAAGVRFTSFVVVEGIAVLAVEVGDGVEVNLLGLARMSLPSAELAIARIEVALRARFSSREMVLSVQAQLTDNSYVLHPSCRLTGGFAMVTWFRTGQFVLTLGGYHPRFERPADFPVVPRLGFTWHVSSDVSVKGEAYFALTSTCVMAGGRLEAGYRTDVVWASFTAGLDAIVSWDPFFYDVSVYVRVAAGVDISIWTPFGRARIRFSVAIGAELRVWGPELRGEARLDLDVVSVTVRFGAGGEPSGGAPIGWHEFHETYLVAGDPEGLTMGATVLAGQLAPDPGAGRGEADTGQADRPWRVQPEFVLQTETRAASNVVNGRSLDPVTPQAIDLGPMHVVDVVSAHTVVVRDRTGTDVTARLGLEPVVTNVPEGIWRKLPSDPAAEAEVRPAFTGARITARAAVPDPEGRARLTQVEVSDRPHPLPFADEIAQRAAFAADVAAAGAYVGAQPRTAGAVLARAAERLAGAGAVGLRTFAAERVAPPRLAPLAEGMVDPLKPPVATTPAPVPEAPARPSEAIGPPRLQTVLRAPAAAAPRAVLRTTVSAQHARAPRREAPTLAGARARATALGAARLALADAPLVAAGATVRAADGGPPSARAGGGAEVRRGYDVPQPLAASLRALERTLADGGAAPLAAGDVQVWELPNAARDAGAARPVLRVAGDQLVRLVALDRAGGVLADATARRHQLPVPRGTARLAAAGLGWPGEAAGAAAGVAGWHAATALRQVDGQSYLGPRCVVTASSPDTRRARRPVTTAVVRAAEAVFGHAAVTTRLPAGTRTVLVAVEVAERPDEALAGLVLGLEGATRSAAAPHVVVSGTRAHGVFAVEPGGGAVLVTIASEERWRLAAVLGATQDAAATAAQVAERGLEALVGDEQASATGTSELRWSDEGGPG